MVAVQAEWTPSLSGGCPKHKTWHANPMFQLVPGPAVVDASYSLTLRQLGGTAHAIGLFIIPADNTTDRKTRLAKGDIIARTKFTKGATSRLDVSLPRRDAGLPYIVVASTFDPGSYGSISLELTSADDGAVRLVPLQPAPSGPAPSGPASPSLAPAARARASAAAPAPAPAPAPARQRRRRITPPAAPAAAPVVMAAADAPTNEPVVRAEGQGISAQQQRDLQELLVRARSSGGAYEDTDFPPVAASLGGGGAAKMASTWRRITEIGGQGARLFKNDWEIEGVVPGPLSNAWLLGALNVVAGDRDILDRLFVTPKDAPCGLHVLRLWDDFAADDDDDDWKGVAVDDRLPCKPDGSLAFARCPSKELFWVPIAEKALAKHLGSYAKTEADPSAEASLHALELLTGGKARDVPTPAAGGAAVQVSELWATLLEAQRTAHVAGAVVDVGAPNAQGAAALGLVPGRLYCVVTAGDMPCGRMMRLRGFATDPEWTGRWSDRDGAWTNNLRQLLNYKKADDGTFWIGLDDFCRRAAPPSGLPGSAPLSPRALAQALLAAAARAHGRRPLVAADGQVALAGRERGWRSQLHLMARELPVAAQSEEADAAARRGQGGRAAAAAGARGRHYCRARQRRAAGRRPQTQAAARRRRHGRARRGAREPAHHAAAGAARVAHAVRDRAVPRGAGCGGEIHAHPPL